jgi:hypothetical protein
MRPFRHYFGILFLLAFGGYKVFTSLTETVPNTEISSDQLVEVRGTLLADGKIEGDIRSFQIDSLPGATLFLDRSRLEPREEQGFQWGMRPGTAIITHVHRDDLTSFWGHSLSRLKAFSLIADVDTLLALDKSLAEEAGSGAQKHSTGLIMGIVFLSLGLIYAFLVWAGVIN